MLKNIVLLVAIAIIGWKLFGLVWPVVKPEGVVEDGSYRGIAIGSTKGEVVAKLYQPPYTRLRLSAYEIEGEIYTFPTLNSIPEQPLSASDDWTLVYPSIHKEKIFLKFENDRLASIRFRRDAIAP